MLTVTDIQVNRGANKLFSGVSFVLSSSQLMVVSGGNGTGKSSLLAAVVGLLAVHKGRVGREVDVFYLSHKRGLRADLTVLENLQQDIRYPLSLAKLAAGLEACGLERLQSRLLRELSAGQQQRVALAKLWLTEAPLWVLDEPLEALDADMRLVIEAKIDQHLQTGGAVIVATHIPLVNQAMVAQAIELGVQHAI
jgi:heme exporter protein A